MRFRNAYRWDYRCVAPEMGRGGYPNLGAGANFRIMAPRWANLVTSEENPRAANAFPDNPNIVALILVRVAIALHFSCGKAAFQTKDRAKLRHIGN